MARKKKSKGGPPHRSGFLFMILILLVLGLLFYIYRDKFSLFIMSSPTLSRVIPIEKGPKEKRESGGLFDRIVNLDKKEKSLKDSSDSKDNDETEEQKESKPKVVEIKSRDEEKKIELPVTKTEKQEPAKVEVKALKKTTTSKATTTKSDINNTKVETEKKIATKKIEPKKSLPTKSVSQIVSKVYFSRVDHNDRLYLVKKERKVSRKLPLTETLNYLLSGPYNHESENEILSNIPGKTRLLSISIKNSVAYLNFSREFEFNRYGKESTVNQLKQIVYTATEFSNISSVQFMIEGKVQTYLGGEGVMINKPLTRKDF